MYDILTQEGVEIVKTDEDSRLRRIYGNDIIKKYNFFKNEFFGIDKILMKLVRFFHSASMGGEESRQVLYLVGGVGSGKSSLMEALKRALQNSLPFYHLEGCPMHEEPLHLIPIDLRPLFEKELGVKIEGELCPTCRYRLKTELNGDYEKFPVVMSNFSIANRVGVGVVPPVDPNNQDTSVLTGSVDISKIDLYAEDDPRILSLNGAFNVGNRGIVEFIEVFKNETEYLHTMITATQEKAIPSAGKGSMLYFDGVILAHSNEAEWNKFKADHTNEAILDRIVKIEIPYCMELDEEVKIYKKILGKSRFDAHIAPHTIEVASMLAVMSRLAPSTKVSCLTKMKIYNGEEVVETGGSKKVDVLELKEETPREGMTGLSTRFIMKAIDTTISESEHKCINPIAIMETLVKSIKELTIKEDEKEKLLKFIQSDVRKEFNKMLEKEITKAFIFGYKEQAVSLFHNYLDHAEAYVNKTKIKDVNTGEELESDEKFLRSIEEQIGITDTAAKGFRADVISYMFSLSRKGQTITYDCYEPLKEAIEAKLTNSVKELSRIITSSRVRDKEQGEKFDAMLEEMFRNGYCPECAKALLAYASNNLWKD
jgi:serine protein kinase